MIYVEDLYEPNGRRVWAAVCECGVEPEFDTAEEAEAWADRHTPVCQNW